MHRKLSVSCSLQNSSQNFLVAPGHILYSAIKKPESNLVVFHYFDCGFKITMGITKVNLPSCFFFLPQNPVWQASSFMIAPSFFQTLPQKWFCHQTFSYLTLNLKHRLCLIPPFRILFLDSFFRTLCLSKKTNIFLVVYVFDNIPCNIQAYHRSA